MPLGTLERPDARPGAASIVKVSLVMETFLIIARSTRGAASAKIIEDATAATGLYVFGELLAVPSIADLANQPETSSAHRKLELFAYGTLDDYKRNSSSFPAVTPAQLSKLKHLTLVSAASKARGLQYSELMKLLDVTSVRELEDLVIDVMYAGLLGGRMDHQAQTLHIEWLAGRDVAKGEIEIIKTQLQNWFATANNVLIDLDTRIDNAKSESLATKLAANDYRQARDDAFKHAHETMIHDQRSSFHPQQSEKQHWNVKKPASEQQPQPQRQIKRQRGA